MTSFQRPSFWGYRSKPTKPTKKVGFGSPAEGTLQRGDIITKVSNYDSRDIRHQDAQTLFNNAGNEIRVVVQRDNAGTLKKQAGGSTGSSHHTYSPLSMSPHLSPRAGGPGTGTVNAAPSPLSPAAYSASVPALTPYYGLPFTPLDNFHFTVQESQSGGRKGGGSSRSSGVYDCGDGGDTHVVNQPYRTTPLVLPGAKVKRDDITESYLRHHPNPTVRASPHQTIDHDMFLKQKVANTVLQRIQNEDPSKQILHKQFNSPIGLYSDTNIADTVYKQTGLPPPEKRTPSKPPPKYNPEESETYKAIQEEQYGGAQEIVSGPQSKVFVPNKVPPAKKPGPVYSLPTKNIHSIGGGDDEIIHQSGSFKRLMYHVMAESNY